MSDEQVRDAIEALFVITVTLSSICERNGMSVAEDAELTACYKRLVSAIGKEWKE